MPSPSLRFGHRGFAPFPVFLPCGRIATCLGTPSKSGETACTLATYGLWQPMALPRKNVGPSLNGHRSWCLSSRSECLSVALISFPVVLHQGAAQYGFERNRNIWIQHTHGRESWIVRRCIVCQRIVHTCRQRVDAGALVVRLILHG